MKGWIRGVILGLVVLAGAGVLAMRSRRPSSHSAETLEAPSPNRSLPRLIDLGSHSCVPCRMMAPILEELRATHSDLFVTEFIDVSRYPEMARFYRIRVIPTQIFLDAGGNEQFRHEGFLSKDQILEIWQRLGVTRETATQREGKSETSALLGALARAVEGYAGLASVAAFVWGILSLVLSPCHLAGIPLIVAFIDGQGELSVRRAFGLSLLFATGLLITIALIGGVTAALGRMMGAIGPWGNWAVAGVMLLIGLYFLDVISLPFPDAAHPRLQRKGLLAALILGLVFGIALGPCTFAYMAPMLAVTFREADTNLPYGLWLLLLFGVGHCLGIVLAGTFTELVQQLLDWHAHSRGAVRLKRACGVLIVLAGLYLLYTA